MTVNSELMKRMQEDIKRYADRRASVRVNLIKKLLIKKLPPERLHPNPDDEFTYVNIGPNESIIERYVRDAQMRQMRNQPIFEEPIIIQKMEFGDDYIILNGHHRWAAALKARIPAVQVSVVNPKK